ncbi:MAG: formylglycine-generating enzyme family protein, partial [Alphaproteobacteria bacterium]
LSERKPAEDRVAVGVYPKAGHRPGETFKDCPGCPEMVVIPPGRFRMGDLSGGGEDNEKPVHAVTIDYKFAVGRFEVTRGEFAAFIKETGYAASAGCWYYTGSDWEESGSKSWRRPGFSQSDRDPVVCVNWDDAQAYLRWLGRKTGVAYRLLSEAEWEYTARAGGTSKYPSGDAENSLCVYGNGADRSTDFHWRNNSCGDGYGERTAPVGSYRPNAFGVFDTLGNVWEWTQDCWHGSYHGATGDGGAWTTAGDCAKRVLRGGSWFNRPWNLRSAIRGWHSTVTRYLYYGFRVARTLDR